MSIQTHVDEFRRTVSGRWPMPLLAVGLALLGVSLFALYRTAPRPTFAQKLSRVEALTELKQYDRAGAEVSRLLQDPDLTSAQRATAYCHLARTIYQKERTRHAGFHNPENARRILLNYQRALEAGAALTAAGYVEIASAHDWLGQARDALVGYRRALDGGAGDRLALRRRLIELSDRLPDADDTQLDEDIDVLLQEAAQADAPAQWLWAVERKAQRLLDRGRTDQVLALTDQAAARLADPTQQVELDYFRAMAWYRRGQLDAAARMLQALRDRLKVRDELDAKSGWLLGRIHLEDDRPLTALSLFEDVAARHPSGEYHAASLVGMGEALARLERYEEALGRFGAAVAEVQQYPRSPRAGPAVVRATLTSLSAVAGQAGRLADALAALQLARRLLDAGDEANRVVYANQLASLHETLGRRFRGQAEAAAQPEVRAALLQQASEHYAGAGEAYLEVARLRVLRDAEAVSAAWNAASAFDAGGLRRRTVEVLQQHFVVERPEHPQTAMALFRLGQAYQAMGDYPKAIEAYERTQRMTGRAPTVAEGHATSRPQSVWAPTPAAMQSLIPLAECYIALGGEYLELAEKTLRLILEERVDAPPVFTPAAREFRDAVYLLGGLLARRGAHEKAIYRLEEALNRYPEDPRNVRAKFLLAGAYGESGRSALAAAHKTGDVADTRALMQAHRERLERAVSLYGEAVAEYERRRGADMSAPERLSLQHAYLNRADCLFDLQEYAWAVEAYKEAIWRYPRESSSLSASVQIIRCYQRMGDTRQARAALEKARLQVRKIPEASFQSSAVGRSRQMWMDYLERLTRAELF